MSHDINDRAARLPAAGRAELDRRMSLGGATAPRREGCRVLYPAIDQVQARALLAKGSRLSVRASRLPAAERRALDERMGLASSAPRVRLEGSKVVYGVMTPEQARAMSRSR